MEVPAVMKANKVFVGKDKLASKMKFEVFLSI